jgi:hypothetical protein
MAAKSRYHRTLIQIASLICLVLIAATVSILLGQDANWDLQNYHFYNPYAFVYDRLGRDLGPAQLQSFFNPLLDLPFYWMVSQDLPPRLISALLAVPVGIAAFALFNIAELLFRDIIGKRIPLILIVLIGLTGTAGVSTIGSTMNEWPGAALVLLALWCCLVFYGRKSGSVLWLVAAGLLSGMAAGLKLTAAVYVVGMAIAILLNAQSLKNALLGFTGLAIGAAVGLLATAGFWIARIYNLFANPVFPFFNGVFKSPWWEAVSIERIYGPHTVSEWLYFPFVFFRTTVSYVGEIPFRDWRLPMLYALTIIGLVSLPWRVLRAASLPRPPVSVQWKFLAVFMTASLLVWIAQHSIYRYLVVLEVLSGLALFFVLSRLLSPCLVVWALGLCTGIILATTQYPDWWRIEFGEHFFDVKVPSLPSNSLVLLVSDDPMAYVIPFLRADARYIGGNSNLTSPQKHNLYEQLVQTTIRSHTGPLFSLSKHDELHADLLDSYGLRRSESKCEQVTTKMLLSPLDVCELVHRSVR